MEGQLHFTRSDTWFRSKQNNYPTKYFPEMQVHFGKLSIVEELIQKLLTEQK
jgi:hypothetical protein